MDTLYLNEGRNVTRQVEIWICWIPPINDKFKLNFGGSKVQNKSALGWIIKDSNDIIKMVSCRHVANTLIIVAKCIALRDEILATKSKSHSNLEIEGNKKIIIDCYNRRINTPSSIMLLMEDIWKLSQG